MFLHLHCGHLWVPHPYHSTCIHRMRKLFIGPQHLPIILGQKAKTTSKMTLYEPPIKENVKLAGYEYEGMRTMFLHLHCGHLWVPHPYHSTCTHRMRKLFIGPQHLPIILGQKAKTTSKMTLYEPPIKENVKHELSSTILIHTKGNHVMKLKASFNLVCEHKPKHFHMILATYGSTMQEYPRTSFSTSSQSKQKHVTEYILLVWFTKEYWVRKILLLVAP